MTQHTPLTTEHISKLSLAERKKLGQYMTPAVLGNKMADLLSTLNEGQILLDPAVGTGELLLAYQRTHPDHSGRIMGWDTDSRMVKVAKKNNPRAEITVQDMFKAEISKLQGTIDYIIANPPYFEVLNKSISNTWFTTKGGGRTNIYALFLEYSLRLLKEGGELVFLIPTSMNNGAYFTKIRQYILENSVIKSLQAIHDTGRYFTDAQTPLQIVHLKKHSNAYEENLKASEPYLVDFNELADSPTPVRLPLIFTSHRTQILKEWAGRQNLYSAGYTVKTGNIPWNQYKESFVPQQAGKTTAVLLYAKDITKQNTLVLSDKISHRFLPTTLQGLYSSPTVIVNRITGNPLTPRLRYCLVNLENYYAENHINVVTSHKEGGAEALIEAFEAAEPYLGNYLAALTGNTQLSATELLYLIPLPLPKSPRTMRR